MLDALDEYGFDIQNIKHNSVASGIILVAMHLGVDVFLIGLAVSWLSRHWQRPPENILARGRRRVFWLLVSPTLFLGFAIGQSWSAANCLLWPLDNMLRVLDVGDAFQLFGWRLHDVDMGFWTRSYALFFRLSAGICLTRIVLWVRLTALHGWGLRVDQLVETLTEGDALTRKGAARALGEETPDAEDAIEPLIRALRDSDLEVRRQAAAALGRHGPRARQAVPDLVRMLWGEHRKLTLAAAKALGQIGRDAHEALEDLWWLWRVEDTEVREIAQQALDKIDPTAFARHEKIPVPAKLPPERRMVIF